MEEIFSLSLGMQAFFKNILLDVWFCLYVTGLPGLYVVLFVVCMYTEVNIAAGQGLLMTAIITGWAVQQLRGRERECVCVLVLIEELMETNSLALLDLRFNSKMHNTK